MKLVHFLTTDNIRLPGLLYEPEKKTSQAAIYLHGNGSSSIFYGEDTNIFGDIFSNAGIAYFPFNNRGAHYIKSLKKIVNGEEERVTYGTTYELIKDCVYDIDGAISYLKTQGYSEFYLIGHSTGANKIVVYDQYKKNNEISKYILQSGGDDTGLYYQELGKEKYFSLLTKSKKAIEEGRGTELIPLSEFSIPYTYAALFDILNPDGDYNTFPYNDAMNNLRLSNQLLFKSVASITKPTLVTYGSEDEFCYGDVSGCVKILQSHIKNKNNFTYDIIEGADHGFNGFEKILAHKMIDFINTP